MSKDKIYYPEVIEGYALPGIAVEEVRAPKSSALAGVVTQEGISDVPFPLDEYAREVISRSLNTQSKKILGNYTFGSMGAFQIGTYENGVSGDLKLSPSGIVGRNSSGATTFSIDGTTGNATFAGTIAAGVVVAAGALVVGDEVGIGTAEDSAGVTTIIGNTVTTGYVNALSVTAGSITAANVTAGTLTGHTFRTATSGVRIQMTADDSKLELYDSGNDVVGLLDENGTDFYIEARDSRHLALGADGAKWVYCNDDLDLNTNDINSVGTLNADTKNFLIPHPDGSNRLLKYTAVESPEVAVSYRGIIRLQGNTEFIPVPKHFELVTEPTGLVTVQITPIGEKTVCVMGAPTNKGFTVKGEFGTEVMFEIKAVRKGFLDNPVEIDLDNPVSEFGKKYVARMAHAREADTDEIRRKKKYGKDK